MPSSVPTSALASKQGQGTTPALLRRIASAFANRLRKSEQSLMLEGMNPLWQMDAKRAQTIYDWARRGNFAQLQLLYNEIENCDATFLTCVTRRCSAIAELDWRVVRSNERLNRNADEGLVREQTEFLETAIARIDNLPEAFEHFALSAFRGYSIVNIHYDALGDYPNHLECLDHWNVCLDRRSRRWMWNPTAASYADPSNRDSTLVEMPEDDIIAVARKRQIDWPALMIFLRSSVAERDWGRFLETYGLPPVILTMPDLTSKEQQDAYLKAAENVFEGRSGVVPFGTEVDYASESRGVDPFTGFIEHQMKLFVLLSTGGTLTSLAESGSGTLAGNAQMEVWKQIVRADTRIISNAFNKQLCERLVKGERSFKGKPVLAEFQLDTTPKLTPDEVADLAGKFSQAGFEMDERELSQLSGFTIRKKQEADGDGFGGGLPTPPLTPTPTATETPAPDKPGDGGGSEAGDDAPTATNASPASIIARLRKYAGERLPSKIEALWSTLSNSDRERVLLQYVGALPRGGYTKATVRDRISDELGAAPMVTFVIRWEQIFNSLRQKDPRKYGGSTTHGLETFEVLNADAPEPAKTPADGVVSTPPPTTHPDTKNAADAVPAASAPKETRQSPAAELAASLQEDFKAVADRINAILALPEAERASAAAKLLSEIDALVPGDSAMAEVIAEQMQEAFGVQVAKGPGAAVANNAKPPVDTHGEEGEPWIGFDLDGTLAKYDGWKGIEDIGKPLGETVELIKRLHAEGSKVKIVTARVAPRQTGSLKARRYIEAWCEKNLGFVPEITDRKDALMETLYDDRVHKVDPETGDILNSQGGVK